MKSVLLALLFSVTSFCASASMLELEKELFQAKVNFEQKAYELKLSNEKQEPFKFLNANVVDSNLTCAEWVYQSSATREEAIKACRGVTNMKCVEYVYQSSATRLESAIACQGVGLQECVEWVYQSSATRAESAKACKGVTDMACVKMAYQGSLTRVQAAQVCGDDTSRCE